MKRLAENQVCYFPVNHLALLRHMNIYVRVVCMCPMCLCIYVFVSYEMTEGKLTSTTLDQLTKCHETQQTIKPDDSFKFRLLV